MSKTVFQIENGRVAFALVDTSEPGYSDDWQAPGGKDVTEVTLADYEAQSEQWSCQITSGALTASPNTNDVDVPATFCEAGSTVPQPDQTSYAVDIEYLQDPVIKLGLSRFLFEHDTKQVYFYLGLNGDGTPPQAIGRARAIAGAIGGPARSTLTATASLPCSRKPQIEFGTEGDSEAVPPSNGGGPVDATGATAGTPGTWTPSGSVPPASVAALQSSSIVASPATAWTTGQFVQTGTAGTSGQAYWDADSWESGVAT
jgi:hypothetical protein